MAQQTQNQSVPSLPCRVQQVVSSTGHSIRESIGAMKIQTEADLFAHFERDAGGVPAGSTWRMCSTLLPAWTPFR